MDLTAKQEFVITKCLETFTRKGLYGTSSRDLSGSLDLQSAGLYYYFTSKDEVTVLCAKRAAVILSDKVMYPTIEDFLNGKLNVKKVIKRASEYDSMLRFLIQAYTVEKFKAELIEQVMKLNASYIKSAEKICEENNIDLKVIKPYVNVCITMITNYMIFCDESYLEPLTGILNSALEKAKK